MTNRQWLEAMSDEELANAIYDYVSPVGRDAKNNRQAVAEWFKKDKEAAYFRAENCKRSGDFTFCLKCPEQNCGRAFSNGFMVE